MKYLEISAVREGYAPDQCSDTMTVRELRNLLDYFDDDLPIYLSHDNGYTYGPITERMIDTAHYDDDDDSEDEDLSGLGVGIFLKTCYYINMDKEIPYDKDYRTLY